MNTIEVDPILLEYHSLEKDICWTNFGTGNQQAGLQYKIDEEPWTSSVGKSKGDDSAYNNLNPFFKNTIFESIINQYQLVRARLMWVGPKQCYSMHKDETPRIHIPLITNPDCYFVFKHKHKLTHLEAGTVYWVETRLHHTFMNCSDQTRLHLVGATAI